MNTPIVIGVIGNVDSATTRYCAPAMNAQGYSLTNDWSGASDRLAYVVRTGGTMSNLGVSSSSNAYSGATTIRPRSGAPYGNLTVTVPANTSGDQEDTTHTDSFDASEEWTLEVVVASGSGTANLSGGSLLFAPASDTVTILAQNGFALSGTADRYIPPCGLDSEGSANEWEYNHKIAFAATWKNLWCRAQNNTRSDTVYIRSSIDGVSGNQVLTWTTGQSTDQEDTTHTDSVSAGSLIDYLIEQNSGSGSVNFRTTKSELVSTESNFWFNSTHSAGSWGSSVSYHPPNGICNQTGNAESVSQVKVRVAFTWSKLWINCSFITGGGNLTVRSRINGANGNQVAVATSADYAEDSTHTDSVADTDKISLSAVCSSGTSATLKGTSSTGAGQAAVGIPIPKGSIPFTGRAPVSRVDYPAKIRIKSVAA